MVAARNGFSDMIGGSGQTDPCFMDDYDERWLPTPQEVAYERFAERFEQAKKVCQFVFMVWVLMYLVGR